MITDAFLNQCSSLLTQNDELINESIISDINAVLAFFIDKENSIPLAVRSKYKFSMALSKLRMNKKDVESSLDDLTISDQFKDLDAYIEWLRRNKITREQIEKCIKQLRARKKFTGLFLDLPYIEKVIGDFNSNKFDNIDKLLGEYDQAISKMYGRLSEEKRTESNNRISSLDLFTDEYGPVLNQIELSYSGKNSISTGYQELDSYLNGGFEPSRLYIFAGSSGDGKSTLLLNFLRGAVERKKEQNSGLIDIYVYITLENLIDESLVRLYCSHTDQNISRVIKNFQTEREEIKRVLKNWQSKNNSAIIMSYFPPTVTSVADLSVYIESIRNRYKGRGIIKGVYIDYLDLLMSGQKFDLHRLEMGQVTIDLKVLAVRGCASEGSNINGCNSWPVISLSQLNRCLDVKSKIITKDRGEITLDQVKVGDELKRGNNMWIKVVQIFPIEKKKCYKIKTKSGKELICSSKHNFPTSDGLRNIEYTGLKIGDKLYSLKDNK